MAESDIDQAIEQSHQALGEIIKGNPEGYKKLYSPREDISLGNPLWAFHARTEER